MSVKLELADRLVVAAKLALALQHVNFHAGLIVAAVEKISDLRVGIVVLRSIIAVNNAAQRLDASDERRHVEQEHVLHVALEHAALNAPRRPRRLRPGSRP